MRYITSVERHGIKKGREEGREEGRKEGLEQAVMEMLMANYPIAEIKKLCHLTETQINKLKKQG